MAKYPKEQNFYERRNGALNGKAKNIIKRSLEDFKKSMKECTFSPNINETRNPRTFVTFLSEQEVYAQKKEENIAELKSIKEKKVSDSIKPNPTISKVISGIYI